MDFKLDPADEAFRREVRAFLREHLPPDLAKRGASGFHPVRADQRRWQRTLYDRGWGAPNWPTQYGGTGWSHLRQFIFDEECALAGAPATDNGGLRMFAPVIYTYASDELKARLLPGILKGELYWGQGFSEPNAGSDLASLSARAIRDCDHYIVNGHKIWTTGAHTCDIIGLLVKTQPDAKQRGISFLCVEPGAAGITIRPIIDIGEAHSLNEVFFDNVRVPVSNLLGEENKGWTYAKAVLENERATSAEVPLNKRKLAQLRMIARQERSDGHRIIDLPGFAPRLAQLEVDLRALEWLTLRALTEKSEGTCLPYGSLLKVRGSELVQRIGELTIEALEQYGTYVYAEPGEDPDAKPVWPPGPDYAPGVTADFMYRRAATIYGGANEVQRSIIARSFLEL
ncbi:MAG: putative acyl-CoA dehydrogenase [Nevskia sp.]|nr:putative acyl-CoA dehydrogenase [Nevskia sp.]